ncbi:MAG: cysteine dioxygenase family protein [Cruoricaptor ignavus]|nr:cysteine dioxygenase family protein [Cruoricaptor ignavus]
MNTAVFTMDKSLIHSLEYLTQVPHHFDTICEELFAFNYQDYDLLFELSKINVEKETYKRIPIYKGEGCVAVIMIWGADNITAIHDHSNYDGKIKVLKGRLTEVSYRENSNFIEYDGVDTAFENQIFPEEYGGIHSIVNRAEGVSVSLHIYRTSQLHLSGVRIFDTEHRRVAWLSENATSCSWNLSENCYSKIVKV